MREDRIFGPPGTGKTRAMTGLVTRAAQQHGSDALVVGSFTRAAATELLSRGVPVPREHVGTLHALAYRALGADERRIADTPELLAEWNEAHPFHAVDAGRRDVEDDAAPPKAGGNGGEAYLEYQRLRAMCTPRAAWRPAVLTFAEAWEAWKRDRGLVDFTDLIELAAEETTLPFQGARVGFFDEAQDFTALELRLVRHWAQEMENVVLAGDDDQTIYAFKGASPEGMLTPELPPERVHILRQSYRVPRAVQEVAERWIAQVRRRQPKEYRPRDEVGFARRAHGVTWRNPTRLVGMIEADLEAGHTVMVLASAAYMLAPIMREFRQAGLAYHNPYRAEDWTLNPLSPARGVSASRRVLAYLRPEESAWGDEARMWTARELWWVAEVLEAKGVMLPGAKARLKALAETQDGVTVELGWEHVLEFFPEDVTVEGWTRPTLEWLEAHLLKSKRRAFEFPLAIARKRGPSELRNAPKVIVGTTHSVKGGEADVVYIVPDLSPAGAEAWVAPGESRDAIVRTFYVAVTRARQGVVLLDGAGAVAPLHRYM